MNDTEIQWHPGFVAAMELELIEYSSKLYFQSEHNLSKKPLQIDLLVIKKEENVDIANEIGRIFKKHNIMEYKSPGDSLNIDTFYKVQAYAALYKSDGNTVDERKAEDITVSIVREGKPLELFKTLKDMDLNIEMPHRGIYYIKSGVWFTTQIIVTKELSKKEHAWIKSLSYKMNMSDMRKLLYTIRKLDSDHEKELADAILEVALRANKDLLEELRGDKEMSGALMELVEPWIQERERDAEIRGKQEGIREGRHEGIREGRQEGIREGIRATVDVLQSLGHSDKEIKIIIMKKYELSDEEAEKYL